MLKRVIDKFRLLVFSTLRLLPHLIKELDLINAQNKMNQIQLVLKYRELAEQGKTLPSFDEVEFRCFSQNGEDGILLYIFSLIGTNNKKCVEICAGNGIECNTANLIINHGWSGLLIDGNQHNVNTGTRYYALAKDTCIWPPKFIHAWVTKKNVNNLIKTHGFEGEIDLLSLDMDGIDYWIWKEIEVISPRVIVLEYKHMWGPDAAVTVPYSDDFSANRARDAWDYYNGASLNAFVKLGKTKGYRLAGCQRYEFNAFFLRDDVGQAFFPEIAPAECFNHPMSKWMAETSLPKVKDKNWVRVD